MNNQRATNLKISIDREKIHFFFTLLRQGFIIEMQVGCSIKTMLGTVLGLNENYVENRIKTIFLDAKPVDNISTACIKAGSVLALSGAMPGLAGATLRRGGQLASFRGSISYRSEAENDEGQIRHVSVKLLNLLVNDLGPIFLKSGILLKKKQLENFFNRQPQNFWLSLKSAEFNGQKLHFNSPSEIEFADLTLLTVVPQGGS